MKQKIRKVGGRAFPNDYDWLCPRGHWCRAFEGSCYVCEMDAWQKESVTSIISYTEVINAHQWKARS